MLVALGVFFIVIALALAIVKAIFDVVISVGINFAEVGLWFIVIGIIVEIVLAFFGFSTVSWFSRRRR